MQRNIITTQDGSLSVAIPEMGVTYHSIFGAEQESNWVYIQSGLQPIVAQKAPGSTIHLLEMGIGTGLNVLLSAQYCQQQGMHLHYYGIEKFPLTAHEWPLLTQQYPPLQSFHELDWNKALPWLHQHTVHKCAQDLLTAQLPNQRFDVVYYDAFAPTAQPELWTAEVFEKVYRSMAKGGILVTYCSKSIVRKALQAAGFLVEKLPGPPRKREILRAVKL